MTQPRLWVKSIPLLVEDFHFKSHEKYRSSTTRMEVPETDPGIWNGLVENLNLAYDKALQTSWDHLNPEELAVKKAESEEIKKDSGYQKN